MAVRFTFSPLHSPLHFSPITLNGEESNKNCSISETQASLARMSELDDTSFRDDPQSLLEEIRRDDTTYSYTSTWSSNFTRSNLVGAGRIRGNLYSRGGLSLEKGLGRLAYRAGIGGYAKLANYSINDVFESDDDSNEYEKAFKIFFVVCEVSSLPKVYIFRDFVHIKLRIARGTSVYRLKPLKGLCFVLSHRRRRPDLRYKMC